MPPLILRRQGELVGGQVYWSTMRRPWLRSRIQSSQQSKESHQPPSPSPKHRWVFIAWVSLSWLGLQFALLFERSWLNPTSGPLAVWTLLPQSFKLERDQRRVFLSRSIFSFPEIEHNLQSMLINCSPLPTKSSSSGESLKYLAR